MNENSPSPGPLASALDVYPGSVFMSFSRDSISLTKRRTTSGSLSGTTNRFVATYGTPSTPGLGPARTATEPRRGA